MKKILFAWLLLPLFCLPSCVKEEENLFDGSAAERMAQALMDYNHILNAAADGWVMEYFSLDMGGYIYLCKFETLEGQLNGTVTVASELDFPEYPLGETVESLYEVKSDQSAILTFNTYNPLFHYFSEPYSGAPSGLRGDYEFTFMEVSSDKIVLRGKKHGDRIVMTPLNSKDWDWDSYLQSIATYKELWIEYPQYALYVNDRLVCPVELNDLRRRIYFSLSNTTIDQRVIYTTTGFRLYEPQKIGATTIEFFTWDDDLSIFKCDEVAGVELRILYPDDYLPILVYEGDWEFTYGTSTTGTRYTRQVNLVQSGETSFRLEGLWSATFPDRYLTLNYSKTTGRLTLAPQRIDVYQSNFINIAAWMVVAPGSLWSSGALPAQQGIWDKKDSNHPVLVWRDAGNYQSPVRGWVLWLLNATGGSVGVYSGQGEIEPFEDCRFVDIVMTKK